MLNTIVCSRTIVCSFIKTTFLISGLSRPLGGPEAWFQRVESFRMATFAIKIKLVNQIKVSNNTVVKALEVWQFQNPVLQVRIEKKNSKFWFVPHKEDIPFEDVFGESWEEEFQKWSEEPLSRETPFKVRRVSGIPHYLILLFKIDHSLMDGFSFVRVIVQLIDILNDLLNGRDPQFCKTNKDMLLPDRDHFMHRANIFPRWTNFLITCFGLIPKSIVHWTCIHVLKLNHENKDQQKLQEMFTSSSNEKKASAGNLFLCVEKAQVRKLVQLARGHNTTMHGLMTAAFKYIIDGLIKKRLGFDNQTMKTAVINRNLTTVGLRRHFQGQVPDDYLGFYAAMVMQNIMSSDNDSFWILAKRFSQDLHQRMESNIKEMISSTLWFCWKCNKGEDFSTISMFSSHMYTGLFVCLKPFYHGTIFLICSQ